jgi:hypothetical protein
MQGTSHNWLTANKFVENMANFKYLGMTVANRKCIHEEIRVKVKLSLWFNWAPSHEGVLGERRYSSTHSLTSALDGDEWSASLPGHFTSKERVARTHWIGGRVSPRAVLDTVSKRIIPSPRRESNPRTPIVQPISQRYTDWIKSR